MICFLEGEILKKTPKAAICLTNQVGYKIHLNSKNLEKLQTGNTHQFYIHSHIKEDCFDLYGFESFEELEFFKQLININGIGPKVGLEILNQDSEKVKKAIYCEDVDFIKKTPGIGPKTAKRIILELKGKVDLQNLTREHGSVKEKVSQKMQEALDALNNLGFKNHEVRKIIGDSEQFKNAEEIITYFLKQK
jgi:Holliday junction DNA helicase RuvA